MAELKKILVSLPDNLLKEVDTIVSVEKINRSEFVRRAMQLYIREKKKLHLREQMKKGYREMTEINTKYAEMCIECDNQLLKKYEDKLVECE